MKSPQAWLLILLATLSTLAPAAESPGLVVYPANGDVEYNPRTPIYLKLMDGPGSSTKEGLRVSLDGKDISKELDHVPNGVVYVHEEGLAVGAHTLNARAPDATGKMITVESKFTIAKEAADPLVVKFNVNKGTILPSNMSQMWLQGDCNQENLIATVSVNLGQAQPMNARGKTIGMLVSIEDRNLFIVTISNTVTHSRYTFIPGN